MSIFAKKSDGEPRAVPDFGPMPPPAAAPSRGYGIAEAIQLMRGLPVDQNPDLVVKVVRATLASLNVRLPDIIEDASKKQKGTQDRIAAVYGQIAELEKQLDSHRKDIAALEADLKETTAVKDRLQMAEKAAASVPPPVPPLPGTPTPPFGIAGQAAAPTKSTPPPKLPDAATSDGAASAPKD
jgi:type II secretory pathway component HofQ